MSTVLRAADSAEFLSIVPTLAGFTPRQSLVMLPFQGKRTHGAMRIDLPDHRVDAAGYAEAAIALVSLVSGTDAVAFVVYTDESPLHTPDGLVLPQSVALDELLGSAEDSGLRMVDALCVTPEGWASYLDDEPELRTVADLPQPPAVPGIADIEGDQSAGAALPSVDLAEKERVARALRDLGAVLDAPGRITGRENPQALAALALLEDLPGFFESLLDEPENRPPFVTAALLWCLQRPVFRDVALTQWATDLARGNHALDAQLEFARSRTDVPDDLGAVFLGRGPRPDPDRLRLALAVVRNAAARAPRASRPGPLTAAAWLSWALGRSTHAAHYLDLVREIDPEYGLAALLSTIVGAGVLPEWTFVRRQTARARGRRTT